MSTNQYSIQKIGVERREEILPLLHQLNPSVGMPNFEERLDEIFAYPNYTCWGVLDQDKLVGFTGAWYICKLYSGNQLELDNFVVDNNYRSKGIGKMLVNHITAWAKENKVNMIELNTGVTYHGAQKFYLNLGFEIRGFHLALDL